VRPRTDAERHALEVGLCSSDACVLRRCHIPLARSRGERVPATAEHVGCSEQSARNAIHACNRRGRVGRVRAMLHQSPRTFDHPTSLWTLPLAADVAFAEGITDVRVSGETHLCASRSSVA